MTRWTRYRKHHIPGSANDDMDTKAALNNAMAAARAIVHNFTTAMPQGLVAVLFLSTCVGLHAGEKDVDDDVILEDLGDFMLRIQEPVEPTEAAGLLSIVATVVESGQASPNAIAWLLSGGLRVASFVSKDVSAGALLESFYHVHHAYRASVASLCANVPLMGGQRMGTQGLGNKLDARLELRSDSGNRASMDDSNIDRGRNAPDVVGIIEGMYDIVRCALDLHPNNCHMTWSAKLQGTCGLPTQSSVFRQPVSCIVCAVFVLGGILEGLLQSILRWQGFHHRLKLLSGELEILLLRTSDFASATWDSLRVPLNGQKTQNIDFIEHSSTQRPPRLASIGMDSEVLKVAAACGLAAAQVQQAFNAVQTKFPHLWCAILALGMLHNDPVVQCTSTTPKSSRDDSDAGVLHARQMHYLAETVNPLLTAFVTQKLQNQIWQEFELCQVLTLLTELSWEMHRAYRSLAIHAGKDQAASAYTFQLFGLAQRFFASVFEILAIFQGISSERRYMPSTRDTTNASLLYRLSTSVVCIAANLQFARGKPSSVGYATVLRESMEALALFPRESAAELAACLPPYAELEQPVLAHEWEPLWKTDSIMASKIQLIFLALGPCMTREVCSSELLDTVIPTAFLYLQYPQFGTRIAAHQVLWSSFNALPQDIVEMLGPYYVQRSLDSIYNIMNSVYEESSSIVSRHEEHGKHSGSIDHRGDNARPVVAHGIETSRCVPIDHIIAEVRRVTHEDIVQLAQGLATWTATVEIPSEGALVTLRKLSSVCLDVMLFFCANSFVDLDNKSSLHSKMVLEKAKYDPTKEQDLSEAGHSIVMAVFRVILSYLQTVHYSLLRPSMSIVARLVVIDSVPSLRLALCDEARASVTRFGDASRKVELVRWVQKLTHEALQMYGDDLN